MKKRLDMKVLGMAAFALLFSAYGTAQEKNPTLKLNLDKAIEIALSDNPTIWIADKEVERVDYSRKAAIGAMLPTIDATGQYSRTLKKQVMYMDMDLGSAGAGAGTGSEEGGDAGGGLLSAFDMSKGMKVGRDNNWNGGFNATLPVIAPQLWKNLQLTKIDVQKSLESARASRYSMVNEVEKAYYNILNAQDAHLVLKQSYDNAKLNADNYKNKFDQGSASEYDVLRAEVQVRNIEPSLLQAENGVKLAKMQLAVLLGIDATSVEIETENKLSDYESKMFSDVLSVDTSLQNNTSLRSMILEQAYAQKALELQRAAYYPTLALSANYTWMSMNNDFKFKDYRWNPYSMINVSISIPIFQGGARYFKVKQSRIGIDQLKYQRQNLVRGLNLQVEAAMDNIEKSLKQISSNKEGVRQAEKAYSIMQKSFEIGSATFVELNDADLALTSSKLSYYQAIYDYLTAKSQLDLVLNNRDLTKYVKQQEQVKENKK